MVLYMHTVLFMLFFFHLIAVTIGFENTFYSVDESSGSLTVDVAVLSGDLSRDVVVRFDTRRDSATGI